MRSVVKTTNKEKPVETLQKNAERTMKRGLPIEEYKRFVYWLEEFRDEPGLLGLTADAALSSIGAFTITLGVAVNSAKATSPRP